MRLPLAPLAQQIDARGGLHALLIASGVPDQSPEYEKYGAAIRRARAAGGLLTLHAADQLCIRLLRSHPVEVFGDAWWPNVEPVAA